MLTSYLNMNKTLSEEEYERIVAFCISWAIGGIYEPADRVKFHEYLKS